MRNFVVIRHIIATALAASVSVVALHAQEKRFHIVWQEGDGISPYTSLLSLSQFIAVGGQLVDASLG